MIKNIFYKIMADDGQRQKMNSLKDQSKIYNLFCENGYAGSFDDFKKEMKDFLNSDDSLKIIHNDFDELSDEMLELVAGGANVKKLVTASIATLMLTFTVSATLGSSLFQGNNMDNDAPVSVSSESNSDGDNKEDNSNSNGGTSKSTSGSRKSRGRSASVGSVRRGGRPSGQSGPDRRAFNPVSTSNADNYKAISSHGLYFDDYISQNPEFLKFLEQNPEIAKHMAKDYHFAKKMMYNNDFRNRVMNDASFRNELIKNGFKENLTNTNKDVSKSNNFNQQFNQQNNRQDDKLIMINRLNNVIKIHQRESQEYAKKAHYSNNREQKMVYIQLSSREDTAARYLDSMVNELKSGAIEDIADSNYAAQYKAVCKEIDDLKKKTFKADYALLEKEVKLLSDNREKMNDYHEKSASDDTKERDYKKMIMEYDKVIKNIQEKINGLESSREAAYRALGEANSSGDMKRHDEQVEILNSINEYKPKFEKLKLKAENEQNIVKQKEQQLKEKQKQKQQQQLKEKQEQKQQQKQKQIATLEKWIKYGNENFSAINKAYYSFASTDFRNFEHDAKEILKAKDTDKYDVEKVERFIKGRKNTLENIFKAAGLNYDQTMFK